MSNESNIELPSDETEKQSGIGPGQMLREAREKLGLSINDVAEKLNFRVILVENIEANNFDHTIPSTFNRGYLVNYSKLVSISSAEVLSKFELLDAETPTKSQMQSFSKITEKQAESNLLMWISYGIIALLIGSTIMWWLQDIKQKSAQVQRATPQIEISAGNSTDEILTVLNEDLNNEAQSTIDTELENDIIEAQVDVLNASTSVENIDVIEEVNIIEPPLSSAIFTFSGDCWVNIYDGSGERIAWGVKKSGYVMELKGIAPFKVTVGKPELVEIDFNGQRIDMSHYNVGNIAKFTLPITH